MPNQVNEFPIEYAEAIDEVLMGATFAGKYNDGAAEFVNGRQISVPSIDFGENPEPKPYNRFKSEGVATIERTIYTLDHDDEQTFYTDALDTIDEAAAEATKIVSEYERVVLAPYIDKYFFASAVGKAKTRATTVLSPSNIKAEIRKARTQFNAKGINGRELYMSSTALGYLEDAIDRQFSNETSITDTVGNYDGFQIYEVPVELLQCDFLAIGGGKSTIKYIIKRAASYLFEPGKHTQGDGWLAQLRWVFGNLVQLNKQWGLYANGAAASAPQLALGKSSTNLLKGLTVAPESGATQLWGHTVSDLQSGIVVGDGSIRGTLKHVSSGALANDWGPGNFIALKFGAPVDSDVSLKVGLDPSQGSGLVALDDDMNGVFKVTDKNAQVFKVVGSDGTRTTERTFDLSGLTLEDE